MPKVSVVTPFYNTAPYLEECIASVLAQTFEDFEYILLDNHSTDGSLDIARRYAERDHRIRLESNESFLNQVPNYNAALGRISQHSTYCKIVQADDWLFPRCLEEMVGLADSDPTVGLVSSYRLAGVEVKGVGLPHTERVVSGRQICRMQLLEGYFFFGSPSTVLYRSDIVRSSTPFFDEGRLHEDTEVCYEILKTSSFGFVHQVLSFTRTDNESIMSSARSFDPHVLDKLIVLKRFGHDYLDDSEFSRCWNSIQKRYRRYLARAKIRRRGPEFWNYHAAGLRSVGLELGDLNLFWPACAVVLQLLSRPLSTLRALSRIRQG